MGHVWTYDGKRGGAARSSIPEETAVERHFYSVEREDGSRDTGIEEQLSKIESGAAPTYEGLLRGMIPTSSQSRADFAQFLAVMYVRTPSMRRMYADVLGRGSQITAHLYASDTKRFEGLLRRAEAEGARALSPEERERLRGDMLDPSKFVMQIAKERTLPVLKVADEIAPLLFEMNWAVLVAEHGFLITSDNPMIRTTDPSREAPLGRGGFHDPRVEVIYPLSPHRLLLLTRKPIPSHLGALDRRNIDGLNRILAVCAERFLYSHVSHKRIAALAAKFGNTRPGVTILGGGLRKFAKTEVARRL